MRQLNSDFFYFKKSTEHTLKKESVELTKEQKKATKVIKKLHQQSYKRKGDTDKTHTSKDK